MDKLQQLEQELVEMVQSRHSDWDAGYNRALLNVGWRIQLLRGDAEDSPELQELEQLVFE